jgi:hypothetical protein
LICGSGVLWNGQQDGLRELWRRDVLFERRWWFRESNERSLVGRVMGASCSFGERRFVLALILRPDYRWKTCFLCLHVRNDMRCKMG